MSESEQRSLQSMQTEVDDYIQQFKTGYFSPLGQMARLTEEVGELAREVNHYYGEKQKKADEKPNTVSEELGDVFFVLISMANSLEIDLTEVFEENMAKFNKRDRYRFERKDGKTHD
ncbi:nucleotide pyrophosphohydrolase [Enterococcus faecalis]|nr:nucleotide pyrophosphohydrolase [Enterococcus faecalis]